MSASQSMPGEAYKLITCILPDDGSDKQLIRALKDEKQITKANSLNCMGIDTLANVSLGELPIPTLVKKVEVVVAEADADALYDYIFEKAHINRFQGGVIWLTTLNMASPFVLPEDVLAEKS